MASIEENIRRLGGLKPIRDPLAPMPEAEIADLERSLAARLPEGYRSFLATYGSTAFEQYTDFETLKPMRPWLSQETGWHFDLFYGAAASLYTIKDRIKCYQDRMPETLLPIGGDGGGNQICLGIAGPERGRIYFWDHEDEWDEEDYTSRGKPIPPDLKFQNVHLIANSFEEFLDQMYVVDI